MAQVFILFTCVQNVSREPVTAACTTFGHVAQVLWADKASMHARTHMQSRRIDVEIQGKVMPPVHQDSCIKLEPVLFLALMIRGAGQNLCSLAGHWLHH